MQERWLVIFACLSFSLPPNALAQEPKQAGSRYETLVVTGTRTLRSVTDSPVSVDVVSGDRLRQVSQTTVAQALNFIPGVVVKRSPKGGYNIQMQGFSGDRVLVLIDGKRVISASGAAADLDQINALDIERIEIVRGAGSVLYGSSAMGGVINIITGKSRRDFFKIGTRVSTHSANEIEGDGLSHQLSIQGNGSLGPWSGGLKAQRIDDAGLNYDINTVAQDTASYHKSFVQAYALRSFSELDVDYRVQLFKDEKIRSRAVIPGQNTVSSYRSSVEKVQHNITFQSAKSAETSKLNQNGWQVSARLSSHNELSGESGGRRDAELSLAQIDSQKTWLIKGYEIVSGLDLNRDTLNQVKLSATDGVKGTTEIDDKSRDSIEAYTQASWSDELQELLVGVRIQNDSDFGRHSVLRATYLRTFELAERSTWQWRSGLGQSYRVPSLKERFYVFDHSNLGYIVLGNQNLTPETALSAHTTFTFDHLFNGSGAEEGAKIQMEVNLHYSDATDFIHISLDAASNDGYGPGVEVSSYKNIGQADFKGVDLSTSYQNRNWTLELSYSYLDARNSDSNQRLENRPQQQVKGSASLALPSLDMNVLLYAVYEAGEKESENTLGVQHNHWFGLNLVVSQKFFKHGVWRLGVDNILNDYAGPGREDYLDIRPIESRKVFLALGYEFTNH